MNKYAIVKRTSAKGYISWEAHKYNIHFRLFGPSIWTEIIGTSATESSDRCEENLSNFVSNSCKQYRYEIIKIVEM